MRTMHAGCRCGSFCGPLPARRRRGGCRGGIYYDHRDAQRGAVGFAQPEGEGGGGGGGHLGEEAKGGVVGVDWWGGFEWGLRAEVRTTFTRFAGSAMACVSTNPLAQVQRLGLVPSSCRPCSKSLAFGVQLQAILENICNEIAPIVKLEEVAVSTSEENEDVLLDM